jgi:hypothetical protein
MNEQERKAFLELVAKLFNQGLSDADTAKALAEKGYPLTGRQTVTMDELEIAYISVIRDLMMDKREDETVPAGQCKRCGTGLDKKGYCKDETCPHSDYKQDETWVETWVEG